MTLVNKLMKAPQVAATMQDLSKEMMKVCNSPWYLYVKVYLFDAICTVEKDLVLFINYTI